MKLANQINKRKSGLRAGLEKTRVCSVCNTEMTETKGAEMLESPLTGLVCPECAGAYRIPERAVVLVSTESVESISGFEVGNRTFTTARDVVKAYYRSDGKKIQVFVELEGDEHVGVFADAYLHQDGELLPLWRKGRGEDAEFCLITDRNKVLAACKKGRYDLIDDLEASFKWYT